LFSEGLAEIVLVVDDVERSARFYGAVVGLTPEKPAGDGWAWFWAGEPGRTQRLALRKGPLLFEEHSPLPEGERWGRAHYAFLVPHDKLQAAVEHLRGNGVEVHGPAYFDWMGATSYYFYDPDGNLLEFWSPERGNVAKEIF
jgi:catechol 2,3-dioxygenase-like lactoylglutathione lyase family enzyme